METTTRQAVAAALQDRFPELTYPEADRLTGEILSMAKALGLTISDLEIFASALAELTSQYYHQVYGGETRYTIGQSIAETLYYG